MLLRDLSPEDWAEIKTLFGRAIEFPPQQRAAVIEGCRGSLRQALETLVDRYDRSTMIMRSGVLSHDRVLEYLAAGIHAFAVGDLLANRFVITRFIAEGGMGEVYEAADRELGDNVALKTILPALSPTRFSLDRFKSEIQLARRVTHPNVCRVFDLFWHASDGANAVAFLSMELVRGQTLAGYLTEHGPFSSHAAGELTAQIASGLDCAHRLKIVHRDLKPTNIMLERIDSGKLRAVVTDFGLALSISANERGRNAGAEGTPAYMAPEQITGNDVSPSTDIFALGLIICDVLTGDHPRLSRDAPGESEHQLSRWMTSHPKIPKRFKRVLWGCLQHRPANRFKDAGALLSVLAERRQQVRTLTAITSAIALVAVVSLIGVYFRGNPDRVIDSVQLTPDRVISGHPALSADAGYLAYMSNRADISKPDIWLQAVGSSSATRVTDEPGGATEPSLSPDGRQVAFRSERDGGGIYVIAVQESKTPIVIPHGKNPAFSPDGAEIAYWTGAEGEGRPAEAYVYSLAARNSRRLAPGFAEARYPAWSPDGKFLTFFGGRDSTPESYDWWAIAPHDNYPTATRAAAILNREGYERDSPPKSAVDGNQFIVVGRHASKFQVLEIAFSPKDLRAFGKPTPITDSDVDESSPTLTRRWIAREHLSGVLHVWRIPLHNGVPASSAGKVSDSVAPEGSPAISADEHWLFFTRPENSYRQLFKVDLSTGREYPVYRSDEEKFLPVPDPAGERVAIEMHRNGGAGIELVGPAGARLLCRNCSRPAKWVSKNELLCTDPAGEIAILNVDTGDWRIVLQSRDQWNASDVDWSAANRYLVFVGTQGNVNQIFAAPLSSSSPPGAPWLPLTSPEEGGDHPRWSADGKRLFYFSNRDGHLCLWMKEVDLSRPAHAKPVAVRHFHDYDVGLDIVFPVQLNLCVGSRAIYFDVGEVGSTVWLGRIRRDPLREFLRRF